MFSAYSLSGHRRQGISSEWLFWAPSALVAAMIVWQLTERVKAPGSEGHFEPARPAQRQTAWR